MWSKTSFKCVFAGSGTCMDTCAHENERTSVSSHTGAYQCIPTETTDCSFKKFRPAFFSYLQALGSWLLQKFDSAASCRFVPAALVPGEISTGAAAQLVLKVLRKSLVLHCGTAETEAGGGWSTVRDRESMTIWFHCTFKWLRSNFGSCCWGSVLFHPPLMPKRL